MMGLMMASILQYSSTDSSTGVAQIVVEFEEVDANSDASSKSVKKLIISRRIFKKSKKPQRSEKFAKTFGSRNVY